MERVFTDFPMSYLPDETTADKACATLSRLILVELDCRSEDSYLKLSIAAVAVLHEDLLTYHKCLTVDIFHPQDIYIDDFAEIKLYFAMYSLPFLELSAAPYSSFICLLNSSAVKQKPGSLELPRFAHDSHHEKLQKYHAFNKSKFLYNKMASFF